MRVSFRMCDHCCTAISSDSYKRHSTLINSLKAVFYWVESLLSEEEIVIGSQIWHWNHGPWPSHYVKHSLAYVFFRSYQHFLFGVDAPGKPTGTYSKFLISILRKC